MKSVTFSNNIKYKSQHGQIKYSSAYGEYLFKGVTAGLALKYVTKGKEIYYINNEIIPVSENHFILVQPEIDFEANIGKEYKETKGLCIDLSTVFPQINIDRILANDILFNKPFSFPNSTGIGQQLNKMATTILDNEQNIFQHECILDLGHHLNNVSESIFHYKKEIYPLAKKETTQKHIIPKLLKAKEYIATNYKEEILLDQIAEHVAISKFQLLKLFKKSFNSSPHEMQFHLKMQEAKRVLQYDDCTISELAFNLGYCDLAAFSKKFKSYFGVPPSYFKN